MRLSANMNVMSLQPIHGRRNASVLKECAPLEILHIRVAQNTMSANSNIMETSGYLSNPPYPINAPNCYWRIVTAPGSVISLSFSLQVHPWHIDCGYNFVTIIDEATINKPTSKICVTTKGEIQTSSSVMKIMFNGIILKMDTLVFSRRFDSLSCPEFHWGLNHYHSKCYCVIKNFKYCNTENGRCVCKDGFSSHDCSFGTVPSTSCAIVAEKKGTLEKHRGGIACWLIHGVGIKFNTRDIVGHSLWNQNNLLLNVYDGNSNASLRLGGYKDKFLKAIGTEMYIESLVPSDYFILSYTTQSSVCVGTMISSSGHISSPQYPKKYPDYSDCQWTIVVNETNFISLRIIDLKLEQEANCNNDYLDIYNGSSNTAVRIGHLCNSPVPIIINSTSNFMYIVFNSDRSIAERGFHADFQAVGCPQHWGKECIPSCQCDERHTLYCNINTGECVCKPGWTGYNCKIQVDLCSSDSCPGNTSCETEDGIISCRWLKGVWAFKVGSVSSAAQKCQRYTCHHSALLSNAKYQADIKDLHRCPCDRDRLGQQWEDYYKICSDGYYCTALKKVAMNILFPNNGRNMLCSYKDHLIANKPYTGHILISSDPYSEENKFNHVSHDWCCVQSNKAALCSKFHSIFPDMGCSNIVPFISATALGDPHFTTLDNFSYTMNGWGEYILMDVQARKFMLQCRTDIVKNENGTMTKATAFVAFAAKEGSSPTFQVQLSPDKTTMLIMANESDITKDFYGSLNYTMITDTIDIRRDNSVNRTQVVAVFPCGVALVIEVGIENLKVEVEVDKSLKGFTRGLLGNFNGNPYDDYQLPNGTVLSANITEEQIFELFASSYQVNEHNSVFRYENGKQMVDYHHFDFIPTFTSSFSLQKINEAEELCGFKNQECIYDFIITENETFAMSTKMFKESHQIKVEKLANTLPEVKILNNSSISDNRWFVLENEVNILIVEASDQDGDVTSMALIEDGGENVIFHKNGTLIYTPKNQEPVLIGIKAKDSKNASSAIMFIEITVCPTCNGHGKYNKEIFSENEYFNGYFSILKCLCYPPYTGEFCEMELDACEAFPCSKGQNCTDLTAEEQGNMTIGYKCGPCPDGYLNSDMNCIDINNCNINKTVCDDICINTEGSFFCECRNGYIYSTEVSSCIDVSITKCISKNTKSWLESTQKCLCKDGWTGNDCSTEIDYCDNHSCPAHLQCQKSKVGYDCVCWNGLKPGPLGTCKDCNRTVFNSNGWIMSSNYPLDYDNDTFCTWTIVSADKDSTITLSITEYEVEGCPNDFLKIYEGNTSKGRMFGPFCNSAPGTFSTTGGAFHVVFTSDFSVTKRGFRGFYSIKAVCDFEKCSHNCEVISFSPRVEKCTCPDWMILDKNNGSRCTEINGCNTTISSSGLITTPLFPKFYPDNVNCFWNVSNVNKREITISFTDFEIEEIQDCGYDSVEFLDGPDAKSLGKFCGEMAPTITSRNIFLLISFVSDSSVSGKGFKGKITIL